MCFCTILTKKVRKKPKIQEPTSPNHAPKTESEREEEGKKVGKNHVMQRAIAATSSIG